VKQYVYKQVPAAGAQLVEGETVSLRLSKDIEKTATNSSPAAEEEWF